MDGDTNDSVSGVTSNELALNGVLKAEDIQTAIINKDVMLSGITTQSPVSSVLAMTTVAMPTVAMPTVSMPAMTATAFSNAISDNIFLGLQSLGMSNIVSELSQSNTSASGIFAPMFANSTGQQRIFLAAAAAAGAGSTASSSVATPNSAASSLPLQQLLIPVSANNGLQQLLTVPLSLSTAQAAATAGNGGQMQLFATPGGHLLSVGSPHLNIATGGSMHPMLMVVPPVNSLNTVLMPQSAQNIALQQLTQPQTSSNSSAAIAALAASLGLGQLLTNPQGQIVAIGSSQLLQQALLAATQGNICTNSAPSSVSTKLTSRTAPVDGASQHVSVHNTVIKSTSSQLSTASTTDSLLTLAGTNQHSGAATATCNGTVSLNAAGMTHITPNINQLLPNTISSSREGVVVDGVNLDEMREFAKQFKIRRLSLGLTQTQVGQALSVTEGPSYSQSAICRFEKLDITPKSAQKIKPVLERWMEMAEERYKNGAQNLSDFIGLESNKKRKRRTSFTPQALEILNEYFEHSTHPSGNEMTDLADKLNFDREVIRVWFCNKRQTLKNSVKKIKGADSPVL